MREGCGEGVFVAEHERQVVREIQLDRCAVDAEAFARHLHGPFHGIAEVERLHDEFGGVSEIVNLGDDLVEAINLLHDDVIEFLSEIGVVEAFRQKLGEGLDRDQGVSNFVRHARGQVTPESCAIHQILLLPQAVRGRQIMHDGDGAERRALVHYPASLDGE